MSDVLTCRTCGFESPPDLTFCGGCGTRLEAAPSSPSEDDAERRQVTVMFCDLVGVDRLARELDPNDLRAVVEAHQRSVNDIVARYDGHVAQYLDNGVMVYFGFPRANEEDPRRAVHSALEIVAAFDSQHRDVQERHGASLHVRVGIHTGLVVAGEIGAGERTDRLALGQTPNLAARVMSRAEAGAVLLSDVTHGLVSGFFECEEREPQPLKGVDRAVTLYRVIGESGVRSRFEVAQEAGFSPFIGRARELAHLRETLTSAAAGSGRIVLSCGEAGVGKSRLQQAFEESAHDEIGARRVWRCSAYHQAAALNPAVHELQQRLDVAHLDGADARLDALEALVSHAGLETNEIAPLLAPLLSLPVERYPPLGLTPQAQKAATLRAIIGVLLQVPGDPVVLFTVEDLHWADSSTLELLELLFDEAPSRRLLVLLTFRPSFVPPWGEREHVSELRLDTLSADDARLLVEGVTGGLSLPADIVDEIVQRTDGIPLFVEELTKMLVESEYLEPTEDGYRLTSEMPARAIPFTLQDSLTARLDRLPLGRDVAQLGAVLGRQFRFPLIEAVSEIEPHDLEGRLAVAVRAQLLFQEGQPPDATYTFKHALVQDAAYETLLKSRRRQLHARVGQVMEESFADLGENEPGVVAYHYEHGELPDQAATWSRAAGQKALGQWAHVEAIHHFDKGIRLLDRLTPSDDRDRRELEMRTEVGVSLISTAGYSAEKVGDNYRRAAELCGESAPSITRYGIWSVAATRGDREAVTLMAEQARRLLETTTDPLDELLSHAQLGAFAHYRGRFREACDRFEKACTLFDPTDPHHQMVRGHDAHLMLPGLIWQLGHPDRGTRRLAEALELVGALDDPFSHAEGAIYEVAFWRTARDVDRTEQAAERCLALVAEHEFPWAKAVGLLGRGWVAIRRGQLDEARGDIDAGLAILDAMQAGLFVDYFRSHLLGWCLAAGETELGLQVADELVARAEDALEISGQPEILRLRGELLVAAARPRDAEASLRQAIDLTERFGCRSLELRAALSLAGLLRDEGRTDEAVDILGPRHAWFTEGLDLPDQVAARELLRELQSRSGGIQADRSDGVSDARLNTGDDR